MSLEAVIGENVDIAAELAKAEEGGAPTEEAAAEAVPAESPPPGDAEEKVRWDEKLETDVVEKGGKKLVDLNALHQARVREREARERIRQLEIDQAAYRARLEERLAKLQPPPESAIPDFNAAPAENLDARVRTHEEQIGRFAQAEQQRAIETQVQIAVTTSEQEFRKEHADYDAAVGHLQRIIQTNLELTVPDPVERATQYRQAILGIARNALATGQNPAELAYKLAQNFGYTRQVQRPAGDSKVVLESVAEGQKSARSMPSGGKPDAQPLTLAALEKMGDEEFDAIVSDDKQWKRVIERL